MPHNPITTSPIRTIAFLGNYLPRKCDIATFTSDLLGAVAARQPASECFAVALSDIEGRYRYPDAVRCEIAKQELASYRRATDFLNSTGVDVVSLQHEFGIFGGPAGSHLLTLLRDLKAPVVTTLHTVPHQPNREQRCAMQELIAYSIRLVVMTERGRNILQEVYHVPPARIDLIPHALPDVPFMVPDFYKGRFGVEGKKVLLTFGFNGIEHVLRALPEVVAEFPEVVYLVLGATHAHELSTRGEAYRLGLEAIVSNNKLEKNVIFHDRRVELQELGGLIGAADVYITPYRDKVPTPSGTLEDAFGAGQAAISTPYWRASELMRNQRGILAPFADPGAIAREVSGLLRDGERRQDISDRAYQRASDLVWSKTAGLYMSSFEAARHAAADAPRGSGANNVLGHRPHESPLLNLDHLYNRTDSTGVLRRSNFTAANHSEGYCTDDNARALVLAVLLDQSAEAPRRVRGLARTYAAFLGYAFNPKTRRFHNFLGIDRHWLDERGSEDCQGRAIWALGTALGRSPHWSSQAKAERLFALALPAVPAFTSPRAWAFSLIGIHEYLRQGKGDSLTMETCQELTGRLMTIFDKVARPGWTWFEDGLTYDNAKLAHALIVSGRATGQKRVYERGLEALRWLVGVQTSQDGKLRPAGSNEFYARNGATADFDHQPIEAHATVSACLEAYGATFDLWWYEQAQCAFDWFLGWNDLGEKLYCPQTGGCRDGLHVDGSNENQGTESTLAFLLSQTEMRMMQSTAGTVPGVHQATSATQ